MKELLNTEICSVYSESRMKVSQCYQLVTNFENSISLITQYK